MVECRASSGRRLDWLHISRTYATLTKNAGHNLYDYMNRNICFWEPDKGLHFSEARKSHSVLSKVRSSGLYELLL